MQETSVEEKRPFAICRKYVYGKERKQDGARSGIGVSPGSTAPG